LKLLLIVSEIKPCEYIISNENIVEKLIILSRTTEDGSSLRSPVALVLGRCFCSMEFWPLCPYCAARTSLLCFNRII